MATIAEIARELGLSKSTVSRALRGLPSVLPETIQAVRQKADELNYIPSVAAAGLSIGRNHAIGVVVPSLNRWFYYAVVGGIDRALADLGYDVVLFDLDRNLDEVTRVFGRSLLRRRVDGLVIVATRLEDHELVELAQIDIPAVAVGPPAPGLRAIGVDDDAVITVATEHLLGLGHRRLGFIGGYDRESLTAVGATRRERAFLRVAEEAGAEVHESWVLAGGYQIGQARRVVAPVMRSARRPTALVCASDEMAIGAMYAILEAGLRVPDDVSVIGVDGQDYAEAFGLTSVEQDAPDQGAVAARAIVAEVEGGVPQASFPPADFRLVVRTSTAPPGAD